MWERRKLYCKNCKKSFFRSECLKREICNSRYYKCKECWYILSVSTIPYAWVPTIKDYI
jgi:hypothetical protein